MRTPGFTLLELMIVLAVAALLAAIAIPAWSAASEAAGAAAARSALQSSFDLALRHATASNARVVLCPGTRAGCGNSFDWSGGWIVFADGDGDGRPGSGWVRREPALRGQVHLRSTRGRRRVVFRPRGGAAAGTNVTFTLCDGRGPGKAVSLVLANSGRLRRAPVKPGAARDCMAPA